MKVSAVIVSRNDDYGGNLKERSSYCFQSSIDTYDEVTYIDWNSPEEDGSLLFRPAGHGALLENLNEVAADLIFIKNIDNVVPDRLKPVTKSYKMALAGLLLEVQARVFEALKALEEVSSKSVSKAQEV